MRVMGEGRGAEGISLLARGSAEWRPCDLTLNSTNVLHAPLHRHAQFQEWGWEGN